jgi:ABC-type transport system involved in multi-copper enzyme maturation permease subunit
LDIDSLFEFRHSDFHPMLALTNYLYRLLPANPILLRVVESAGKRRRDLIIRCAYLGLLIFLVIFSLAGSNVGGASLSELAKSSTEVFQNLSYLQLALVSLLAPIFTAGAITQEKDSQTYDILLATPLTNGQIVLGSLMSRLFFVIALLVSGIPIFSITQIFGGVAINNIVVSFLIAAATACVTGALAMAIATFKVGTRRTIFSFYLFIVLYLVGIYLLDRVNYFHPVVGYETNTLGQVLKDSFGHPLPIYAKTSWLTGLHPFLALRTIFFDKSYLPPDIGALPPAWQAWPFGWYLSSPASFYIVFMFALSLLLVTPSVILLRRLAQTNVTLRSWVMTRLHLSTGDRTRKPRSVWSNPIAWREAKTKASAARASLLRYGFMAAGVIGALVLVYRFSQQDEPAQFIDRNSYDSTSQVLTVFNHSGAQRYAMAPGTQITVKPAANSTAEGRAGTTTDLRGSYAAEITTDARNVLQSVTLTPIPRRISEADVRDYLLGAVTLEFAVVLLIVTNAAASTVTREKEDGSLDLLLTTPITSRYYIWGKLSGLVGFVIPLVAVPVVSVLIFVFYDLFRVGLGGGGERWIAFPEAVIIMPAVLIIVTAFAAILGMYMSLRCRTTVLAVMSSVGIVAAICGGLGWCGYSMLNMRGAGDGPFALIVGSFSPFTVLSLLINPYEFAERAFDSTDAGSNRIAIFISSAVAVTAYSAIVWAMYKAMVKNFDMTIRRQSR